MLKLEGVNSILFAWARSRLNYIQRLNYSTPVHVVEEVMSQVVYLSNLVKWKGSKQVMRGEPVAAIGRIQERDNKGKLNRCQRRDNITQYPPSYSCILMQTTYKLCISTFKALRAFVAGINNLLHFVPLLYRIFIFAASDFTFHFLWLGDPPKKKKKKTAQLYHASSIINAETDLGSHVQHLHSNY